MDQTPLQEPQQPSPAQSSVPPDDVHDNKDLAAISYVWILSVLVFVTKRHSPFVHFHVKQALVLFALSLVAMMASGVISNFFLLVILAFCVLGFLNAAQGLKKDLPIIGPIARADIPALKASVMTIWTGLTSFFHRHKKPETAQSTPPSSVPPPTLL